MTFPRLHGLRLTLCQFTKRRSDARRRYNHFVLDGVGRESIWSGLRQQIYLGDEKFVERMRKMAIIRGNELTIPRVHRRGPAPSLEAIARKHRGRNAAIIAANATDSYSYREIADHFGLHLATIGRIIRANMQQGEN